MKALQTLRQGNTTFDKQRTTAQLCVNNEIGINENRKRSKESDVDFDVVKG